MSKKFLKQFFWLPLITIWVLFLSFGFFRSNNTLGSTDVYASRGCKFKEHLTQYLNQTSLLFQVICGQYLSKSDLSNDIVDPFVSVEIFGVPADESKFRTRPVKNNGN